jgi:hypothetical protein
MGSSTRNAIKNDRGEIALVSAGEASYHRLYDHCVVKYLQQAAAKAEWVPLDAKVICGNGYMVMIEKNNLDIAKMTDDRARKSVK